MSNKEYFVECKDCGKAISFGVYCLSCLKKRTDDEKKKSLLKNLKNVYHCGHNDCSGHESRFESCENNREKK